MTLEKAIEKLTDILGYDEVAGLLETQEAISLGIEALKRCQEICRSRGGKDWQLLPGETEK